MPRLAAAQRLRQRRSSDTVDRLRRGAAPQRHRSGIREEALRLFDQQYWDIDSLDLSGGTTYGIFVSGTKGILHHIHLSNLAVHDVFGGSMKSKDNGLVVFSPRAASISTSTTCWWTE